MQKQTEPELLNWQDYWKIAVRRRWYFLGPLFTVGLLGCLLALVWPERYRSEALILVENQKVANELVTPNVVSDLQARLQAIKEQILSRTRLLAIIQHLNLYPQQSSHLIPSDLVNMIRQDITIEPVKAAGDTGELTAFRIAYTATSPSVAQQVTDELTSMFIASGSRDQSSDTTKFLETQVAEAQQRMTQAEDRLRQYKMQYLGELPEQQQSNLQILSSLQAQLTSSSTALDRLEQDKTYLESMKAGYRNLASSDVMRATDGTLQPTISPQVQALADARAKLVDLEAKYTDKYPEVIRTKQEIARLQVIVDKQKSSTSEAPAATTEAGNEPVQPGLIEIDSRLKAVRAEIADREKEINSLRGRIQTAQNNLNLTPVRGEQLTEVSRDYDNAKAEYTSLLQRESESALASNLEKRRQGEQFRVIDPPSLPDRPIAPNHLEIIFAGWLVGVLAGIALVAVREMTDTRLHAEADVKKLSALPLLVSIPELRSASKQAAANRFQLLEALAAGFLIFISVGFGAYIYYWVK